MTHRTILILVACFTLGTVARAQDAPSQFWTRQQIVSQSLNAGLRVVDAVQTCHHLAHGWVEAWEPSQSCGADAALTLSGIPASIGLSYMLHRMHHDRAARFVPAIFASGSAVGIAYSFWPRKGHPCATNQPCN